MAKHSDRHIMRQQKKLDKKLKRQLKPKHINAKGDTTMIPLDTLITRDHLTRPLAPGGGFEPPRSTKQ